MTNIKENLIIVQEKIAQAAKLAGRQSSEITLLAVSKTFAADVVNEALAAGITAIGENRVQEAAAKFPLLQGKVEKHLIGPLQTNKVNKALELFDLIQSLDSVKLARKLDEAAKKRGHKINVLVEVNCADEPQKHGVAIQALRRFLEEIAPLDNLQVRGLMAIPPASSDPEASRPYFRKLRELYELVPQWGIPNAEMRILSMGMSHDFTVAIEEGATLVRIGSALFGERYYETK